MQANYPRVIRLNKDSPFLLLFLLPFLWNCQTGVPCETSNDCSSGNVCHQGQCFPITSKEQSGENAKEQSSDAGTQDSQLQDRPGPQDKPAPDAAPSDNKPWIVLTALEGDGTPRTIAYGVHIRPSQAKESPFRFRKEWVLKGVGLSKLTGIKLVYTKDKTKVFNTNNGLKLHKGNDAMRMLTLPRTLFAGMFFMIGMVGTQEIALGQVFVLQGEKGDTGAAGRDGKDGQDGKPGENGRHGVNGQDGKPGAPCKVVATLKTVTNGVQITFLCGKDTHYVIVPGAKDGARGPQGERGAKGDKGDGFDATTLAYLKALQSSLKISHAPKRLTFTGVNVHIVNGTGKTASKGGYGNLIIGYNEKKAGKNYNRLGSHNLVIGDYHSYESYGGLVAGRGNRISAPYSSITGGEANQAVATCSQIGGGYSNTARQDYATVSGGYKNEASGKYSCVLGGHNNHASGTYSTISGGRNNQSSGDSASVSGGSNNLASGANSNVSGGEANKAAGYSSCVAGSTKQTAPFNYSYRP